jgi:hypothetical protein
MVRLELGPILTDALHREQYMVIIGVSDGTSVRQQNLVDDVPMGVVEEDEAQQQQEVRLKLLPTLSVPACSPAQKR